jgi:predicted aldo/keto reductase-like oxidoreductase
MQVGYNIIQQLAAVSALNLAKELNLGVTVMRPMTSGQLSTILEAIEPRWVEAADPYAVSLKFVMSDSRVHMANVGMRWPHEVEANAAIVSGYEPSIDIAKMQRTTLGAYRAEDVAKGLTK